MHKDQAARQAAGVDAGCWDGLGRCARGRSKHHPPAQPLRLPGPRLAHAGIGALDGRLVACAQRPVHAGAALQRGRVAVQVGHGSDGAQHLQGAGWERGLNLVASHAEQRGAGAGYISSLAAAGRSTGSLRRPQLCCSSLLSLPPATL